MNDFLPVGDYLPHRAPLLLLERVLAVTPDSVVCAVTVSPHGVLAP